MALKSSFYAYIKALEINIIRIKLVFKKKGL